MKESKLISRRSFLKGGVTLVGAGAVVGGLGAASLVRAKGGPPSNDPPPIEPLGFLPYTSFCDIEEVRRLGYYHFFKSGG